MSSLRRELSPTRTLKWQITCNTSIAYHVQHAVCHVVRRDSLAIKFGRVETAFILALFSLAETINDKGIHEMNTFCSDKYNKEGKRQRRNIFSNNGDVCLLAGCLPSQQHVSVSQGRICSDNFTCCHTEIEVADQTFHLT